MHKDQLVSLLKKNRLTPRREQGQNFLIDDQPIQASLAAAEITPEDTVLEIGPGFGALTSHLVQHAKQVIAVEQDRVLARALTPLTQKHANLTVINQDIRTFHRAEAGLTDRGYTLIANLPYSLTSWILREFTEHAPKPKRLVVMVQKEVAERVVAPPGKMSILSAAIQLYTEPHIVTIVDRTSFHPIPDVDSAILRCNVLPQPRSEDPEQLMQLIKIGFSSRRKQIHNNISAGFPISSTQVRIILADIGLSQTVRPQELSLEDWEAIRAAVFQELGL